MQEKILSFLCYFQILSVYLLEIVWPKLEMGLDSLFGFLETPILILYFFQQVPDMDQFKAA